MTSPSASAGRRPASSSSSAGVVVAALGVDPREAVEQRLASPLARSSYGPAASSTVVVSSSLAAICDASARCQIRRYRRSSSGLSDARERVRVAPEARRADRLVRLLGALRLRLVDAALGHRVRLAEALADDVAGLAHRDAGDRGRVGPHVGDEPDVAVGRVDALVQALGDRHRPLRAEAELAARLLLERRGRERRRRAALLGARRRSCVTTGLQRRAAPSAWRSAVASSPTSRASPSIRTSSAANVVAGRGREERLERPVLAGGERVDLALALDDEADGDRLDAAGRQAAADLAREQRAERVADEAVDDPARLLGVDEVRGRCRAGWRTRRGWRAR